MNMIVDSKYAFELSDFTHWFPAMSIFDIKQLNASLKIYLTAF